MDNSPVKHFLLKFDVTGANGQPVTNAKIRLYNVNSANEGGDFYHVSDDSWQEETVTWNNAPMADTQLLASLGSVSPSTWYEVDVTSTITGDGTYSFRISDSTGGADYSSKEGANPPQLVITLGGTPAPTSTHGPTNTPTNTPTPGPSPTPTNTATPTVVYSPTAPAAFNNAAFVYDGDGRRVKSTFNGSTTTYFVGAQALALAYKLGDRRMISFRLLDMGMVALRLGQPERAAKLIGTAEVLAMNTGIPFQPEENIMAEIRTQLSESTFESLQSEGRALPLEQAIALALEEMA